MSYNSRHIMRQKHSSKIAPIAFSSQSLASYGSWSTLVNRRTDEFVRFDGEVRCTFQHKRDPSKDFSVSAKKEHQDSKKPSA